MKRFNRLALILMIFTFVLVAAGGLVTSTGSGLSVPDWPLSFGMMFPPMTGGVQFEHTHRVIAGVVLLLTLALSWIARSGVPRSIAVMTWIGLPLVLLQALLGGLTVLYLLPLPISVFHACLGQVFFSLTVALWWLSADAGPAAAQDVEGSGGSARGLQRGLGRFTLVVLLLQLFLGAYVRHSGGRAIIEHIGGAFATTACVASLAFLSRVAYPADKRIRLASGLLLIFLIVQIALGYGSFVWTVLRPASEVRALERVLVTSAHQTIGALILAFSMVMHLASITKTGSVKLKR